MILQDLKSKNLIHPPKFLVGNTQYLTRMGSEAYGVSIDNSDIDMYGFTIPPKELVFPHLDGEILGFGKHKKRFDQFQAHHIEFKEKQYDFSIYSIIKYFQLCMENNPNMIDSLFTPFNCVTYITSIGQIVREDRKLFLHKGCWAKFKGYSYSELHKMRSKTRESSTRKESIAKYGYDLKGAYNIVRLLSEVEMILEEGDLDLQRNREQLKSIRRGEWTEKDVVDYFSRKEIELETLYQNSSLPYSPDEHAIKQLLLNCLEQHYGSIDMIVVADKYESAIKEIGEICSKVTKKGVRTS
ncbi:hypothetical protein LCGC14_0548890 [marine sediment metagenome]|uniref:Nucleotidyltransferase n=1 Tax=marine sediment metagenome TaxID=412755 RepID=A0A0F9RVH1_9ZZZZ